MGSVEKTASHSHSNQVLLKEPCCTKWLLIACLVGGAVGMLFTILGALQVFGAIGDIGFIASIAAGGGLVVVSVGSGLWVVMVKNSPEKLRKALRQQQIMQSKLHTSILFSDVKSTEDYLRQGADVNGRDAKWKFTPLYRAVSKGDLETVKLLVKQDKIDLEAKHTDKKTALHQAVEKGFTDIVEALVLAGANVDAKTMHEETPLHLAAQGTKLEIVQFLVDRDEMNREVRDSWGNTPLLTAFGANRFEIAQFLYQTTGANLEAVNKSGATALHLAALNDNTDAIEYLLEQRLDINAKDEKGRTPLHYAALSQTRVAYQYLLEKGAHPDT